ncbi:MAG: cupin domain-containing protein [Parvularculaceae bacterium]|nr:cupin domain-containing protein [Parvularculaceae bacterium]
MKVTRFKDAKPYKAPNHFECASLRLQGFEASNSENFWVGLSHFLPGGGCTMEATPLEKVYVVVSGEITVITKGERETLGVHDSCHIPANEGRQVINETNAPASMIVVMPYPKGAK